MMKYVSCTWTSRPTDARNSPVNPPMVKSPTKPMAYSIGVSHEIDALYIVAVQLKTLMADGIATMKLSAEKIIAEHRLAAEGGHQLADDPHRWQHHDVDGRVGVEPEQMLEQHRVAAECGIEEPEVEQPLDGH